MGKKKRVMQRETMGEEEAEHFLLEKSRGLRVRGQLKRERRVNVIRGNGCANFVG
jgi:hypothetical protein